MPETEPFWSDGFDMDLLKILPGLPEALGPSADLRLWTHGGETHGRLNHPSVWGESYAYFGTDPAGQFKPDAFFTEQPVIECTWLEVLRDAWPHTYIVAVNRRTIWDAYRLWPIFEKLMHHTRGRRELPNGAEELKGYLLADVIAATGSLRRLLRESPRGRFDANAG